MPAAERLEYVIQATALIWEPLEQVRYVVSGDVDFDSFGMAPWDAGGIHSDICQSRETFRTIMLQWLMWLLCRQAIMNGLNGAMRINTEYGLVRSLMTTTDSPRLAATPGEWYASETMQMIRTDLRQMNGITRIIGAMCDCWTVGICPQLDSAAADCGVVELIDLIVHRTSFSAGRFVRRAQWRLYMARPVNWPVSMQSISDGVTHFRISPRAWTMLSMAGSPPFSLDRECGSSAVSSSSLGG